MFAMTEKKKKGERSTGGKMWSAKKYFRLKS